MAKDAARLSKTELKIKAKADAGEKPRRSPSKIAKPKKARQAKKKKR
jgi:hypothetical protein